MKTWKPMSGAYTAPNGLTVTPVGSEAALEELGAHFMNGLMVPQARGLWSELAMEGKRQMLGVRNDRDELVANAELKVGGSTVKAMFVRRERNEELAAGSPEFDAVHAYVEAVNAKTVRLAVEPRGGNFVPLVPEQLPQSPWERAKRFALSHPMISPFAALVLGVARNDEAAQDDEPQRPAPFEDVTWTRLSGPFRAANGVTVEPVGSRSGLRMIGQELENNLFVPQMTWPLAHACQSGRSQMAAIYKDEEGVVAYAEFRPVRGQLVAAACRGYADEAPPMDVARAVQDYVRAVNTHVFATNVALGADCFVEGPAAEFNPFAEDVAADASSSLPKASRTGGYDGAYGMGVRDEDELEEEREEEIREADGEVEVLAAERWQPLTDAFVAPNGFKVEPVVSVDDLRAMGTELHNALSVAASMWARKCACGDIQIVRIEAPQADGSWTLYSNAELGCMDGQVRSHFNRADHNVTASGEANEALAAYVQAVNTHTVAVHCELGNEGFVFPEPQIRPGM